MGGGSYNTSTSKARAAANVRTTGSTFAHTANVQQGKASAGAHPLLDPKWENKKGPHTGKNIREAMKSDDHPNPTAIAVAFDETGSMGSIPRVLQDKLHKLNELLQLKGYVEDPQILFGAIGDGHGGREYAPLQVGQFESDNAQDDTLMNIYLEGNGGGQGMETYELFLYFMWKNTYLQTFEEDGKKGYLFTMGDERPYSTALKSDLNRLIGTTEEADVPTEVIAEGVKEKFDWYHLIIKTNYPYSHSQSIWEKLAGKDHVICLENPETVCEIIALTIATAEGSATLDDAMQDLQDQGFDPQAVQAAGKALAPLGANATAVAKASAELPDDDTDTSVEKL